MKRGLSLALATVFGFVLMVGAGSAFATLAAPIRVNVPFDFVVGGTTLPAGEYVISRPNDNSTALLAIRSIDGKSAAFVQADPLSPKGDAWVSETGVIFQKVNGRQFLARVWESGSAMGYSLTSSSIELKAQQVASAGGK
jgi:hypothetical protein